MNLTQAFKMAWKSIWGKRGRSALTILSIFIGIAAVMTIVAVMEGMKQVSMEQFEAMGSNRINVSVYSWVYDEQGNDVSPDYFPVLYDFCGSIKECVAGVTPTGYCNATVIYGTKNTANMEYQYDDDWNLLSAPPNQYYGSDQYSVCNNLTVARGRDIAYLDCEKYNQVCVIGAEAARLFFGSADPVGKILQVNGNAFTVVGMYAGRVKSGGTNAQLDNFIVYPYTAYRLLGGARSNEYLVKAKDSESMEIAISRLGGFLKGLVPEGTGGYSVYSDSQWQQQTNEYLTMISLVLGGIAAISLLVGGIGIMNMMLVTLTERTREIGVRRAIGAQRSSIVVQFLIEAAMLCGLGGIMGILVGTLGSVILSQVLLKMTVYPATWVTLAAFALSVALGLIFGSYPAAKAAKLQPVEALRAE
ncbi:MAG: ABC transporter permease [Oscillibacter sp.]|nr:ABC transporter permease [Oscillibacter sp.]